MIRVHAVQTGRLIGNRTFLRAQRWSSLLRPARPIEFPVYSFIVEHPEGLFAIDSGMNAGARVSWAHRRFVPRPVIGPDEEIGPQMRARGLDPRDVRRVVVTHLDWDHVGGVAHFPDAEVLVHRPEHEFASTSMGRFRYQPQRWPAGFAPTLFGLDDGPYGPFPASRVLSERGDVRAVPLPGHTIGQVGVLVETDGPVLLFAADHVLRQDWFLADFDAGRLLGLGIFFPDEAIASSRRVRRLMHERPTLLLPAHDADVPTRLATITTHEEAMS